MATIELEHKGEILVVDDSPTSRTWTLLHLQQAGYPVRQAESAAEAFATIAQQPPDLIMLDVVLPDMDGFEVTRRLRADPALYTIPIILVTSLGDLESKVQGLEAGANDFLTKPPDEAEMLARVRILLRLKRNQEELLAERNKTALLYRVSRQLSSELDMDSLLARILELTIAAIGATRGSVILLDERGGVLRNIYSHQGEVTSVTDQVRGQIVQDGLAGWVIQHRAGTVVPDTSRDSRWIAVEDSHTEMCSALSVPLLHQDRVTGVLTLTHEQRDRFTPAHLDLLNSIASQAAVVIEKAHAYLKEQLWAQKLQFVHGVGHHVTSLLDPSQIMEEVAWLIRQTFDYYYVELALLEGEELVFSGWSSGREDGLRGPPVRLPLSDECIVSWVASHGRPLLVPDVHQELRYCPVAELPATIAELAVPLQAGGEILGVLDVQSDRYGQLTAGDVPLLEILASQVAVALINAQLFEAVERERGRLSAILTGTDDVVIATDDEGQVMLVNPAAEGAFGVCFSEVIGRPLEAVFSHEALLEAFHSARGGTGPAPRSELALPDGRTLFFSVSPVASGPKGGGGWVAVMQDITHLKELDRMKNEFVATVSHDLRLPLTTIRGYADLMLQLNGGGDQEYLKHIKTSAEQMAELVEDLLGLGKIEAGVEITRIPCRIEKIVEEAVETARFQAQLREIELTSTVAPLAHPVRGDPRQLRQLLDNLLSNALKYTPAGGAIAVRTWEEDVRTTVAVQDSGIGIPREALPRLFEKFYRVPSPEMERIPGTGLGLAIVKAIVEQHHGQIWVESELGQGSTFRFSLPRHDQASDEQEQND